MNEYDKKRFDDDPLLQIFKNWQFYASAAMALIAIGGFVATIKIMGGAVTKGEEFQTQQISINTRLTTLLETHDNRLHSLEDWRNGVNDVYIPPKQKAN